eukprot:scaffold772_cov339-Pavlova_lutheri.AAC.38
MSTSPSLASGSPPPIPKLGVNRKEGEAGRERFTSEVRDVPVLGRKDRTRAREGCNPAGGGASAIPGDRSGRRKTSSSRWTGRQTPSGQIGGTGTTCSAHSQADRPPDEVLLRPFHHVHRGHGSHAAFHARCSRCHAPRVRPFSRRFWLREASPRKLVRGWTCPSRVLGRNDGLLRLLPVGRSENLPRRAPVSFSRDGSERPRNATEP